MSNDGNLIIYGSGLFGRNTLTLNNQQLTEIQGSGFTTVILWALHVDSAGDFYYNNTLMVQNGNFTNQFSYLPALLNDLKDPERSSVRTVLFSIGGWDVGDFKNIQNLLASTTGQQTLFHNFDALFTALPLDGFDFDCEESGIDVQTIVTLTIKLGSMGLVTYCPYDQAATFWIPCLESVYQQNPAKQIVSWMNLQCYAGGAGNNPKDWVDQIDPAKTGIDAPVTFVNPGYECVYSDGGFCNAGDCPSTIQAIFTKLSTETDKGIQGGFIWNSSGLFSCENSGQCSGQNMNAQAYALAMDNGLFPPTVS